MEKFAIVADSTSDLSPEFVKRYKVGIAPLCVSFDKQTYLMEDVDITRDEFYDKLLAEKVYPVSSLPPMQAYIDCFTKNVSVDLPVLCITMGADMSGSHQCAQSAALITKESFPNAEIKIVDSRKLTAAEGILVLEACKMKEAGYTLDEAFERLEEIKDDSYMFFTMATLDYLQKGGRLGKASALAGTLLNIKPILCVRDGCVNPHLKSRGRRKSLVDMANTFGENMLKKDDILNYSVCIGHTRSLEDAKLVESILNEKYNIHLAYPIFHLGVTVGCHCGPSAVGVGAVRKFDAI